MEIKVNSAEFEVTPSFDREDEKEQNDRKATINNREVVFEKKSDSPERIEDQTKKYAHMNPYEIYQELKGDPNFTKRCWVGDDTGLFESIKNTIVNYSSKREETYEWVQDASWNSVYSMLKNENVFSAKGQALKRALSEKLEEEDSDILQQFYEHEVKHYAKKTNPIGFLILRKEMERRGIF